MKKQIDSWLSCDHIKTVCLSGMNTCLIIILQHLWRRPHLKHYSFFQFKYFVMLMIHYSTSHPVLPSFSSCVLCVFLIPCNNYMVGKSSPTGDHTLIASAFWKITWSIVFVLMVTSSSLSRCGIWHLSCVSWACLKSPPLFCDLQISWITSFYPEICQN